MIFDRKRGVDTKFKQNFTRRATQCENCLRFLITILFFPRNRLETKSNTVKQPTAGGDHGFSDNVAMELGEVDNGEYASVIERPVQTGYQGLDVSQMENKHDYI